MVVCYMYHSFCVATCSNCENDGKCNRGTCDCSVGFYGETCENKGKRYPYYIFILSPAGSLLKTHLVAIVCDVTHSVVYLQPYGSI